MNTEYLKWAGELRSNLLFKYLLFLTNYYFIKPSHIAGLILISTNFILVHIYYLFNELTCIEYHFTEKTPFNYIPKKVSDAKFAELAKNFNQFATESLLIFNQSNGFSPENLLNLYSYNQQKNKFLFDETVFNMVVEQPLIKNFKEIILIHFSKTKTNFINKSYFPVYIFVEQRGYVPFWSYYHCKIIYRDFDQNGISLSTFIYQKLGYKFEYFSTYWDVVKKLQFISNIIENFIHIIKEPIILGTIATKSMVISMIETANNYFITIKNYPIIKPILSIIEVIFKVLADIISYFANIGDELNIFFSADEKNFFRIFQILREAGLTVEEIITSFWPKTTVLSTTGDTYYNKIKYGDYLDTLHTSFNTNVSLCINAIQFIITLLIGHFLNYFQAYNNSINTPDMFESIMVPSEDEEIEELEEKTIKETQRVIPTALQQIEQLHIAAEQINNTILIENESVKPTVYKVAKTNILARMRLKPAASFEVSTQATIPTINLQSKQETIIDSEINEMSVQKTNTMTQATVKTFDIRIRLRSAFEKVYKYIRIVYGFANDIIQRADPLYFWLKNILENEYDFSHKFFIDYRWNASEEATIFLQKDLTDFAKRVGAELLDNFVRIKLKDPNYELFQWGGLELNLKIRLLIKHIEQNQKNQVQKSAQDIINEIAEILTKDSPCYYTGSGQFSYKENELMEYYNYEFRVARGLIKIYDRLDQGLMSCNHIIRRMKMASSETGLIDTITQLGSEGRGLSYYLVKPKSTIYNMFYFHRNLDLGKPNTNIDLYELLKEADIYDILSVEERQEKAALIRSSRKMPEVLPYFQKSCITFMDNGFRLRSDINILTENLYNIFTLKLKFSGLVNPNVKFYYDKDPIADAVFFMRDSFRFFPRPLIIKFIENVEIPKENSEDLVFATRTISGLIIGRHTIFSKTLSPIIINSSDLVDLEMLDYIPDHILIDNTINLKNSLQFPALNIICSTILSNFHETLDHLHNKEFEKKNDSINQKEIIELEIPIVIEQKHILQENIPTVERNVSSEVSNKVENKNVVHNLSSEIGSMPISKELEMPIKTIKNALYCKTVTDIDIQTANAILYSVSIEQEKLKGLSAVDTIINFSTNMIIADNTTAINLEYPDLKKNPILFPPENETEEIIEIIIKKYSKTKEQLQNETIEERELRELQMEFEIMQTLAKEPGGQFAVKGYAIPTHTINKDALIIKQVKTMKTTDNFAANQPALVRHPALKDEEVFFDYFAPNTIKYINKTEAYYNGHSRIMPVLDNDTNSKVSALQTSSTKNTFELKPLKEVKSTQNFFGTVKQHIEKFVPKKTIYTTTVIEENEMDQKIEINNDLHSYEVELDPVERFFATLPKAKNPGKYLRIEPHPNTTLHREIAEHEAISKRSNEEFRRTHSEAEYLDRLNVQEARLMKYREGVNKFLAARKEKEELAQQASILEREVIAYSQSKSKFSEIMSRIFGKKK